MKNNWGEITQIACGENYQMFVSNFGELYGCGSNKNGQLGCETDSDQDEKKDDDATPGYSDEED